jgi:hypothetical protein
VRLIYTSPHPDRPLCHHRHARNLYAALDREAEDQGRGCPFVLPGLYLEATYQTTDRNNLAAHEDLIDTKASEDDGSKRTRADSLCALLYSLLGLDLGPCATGGHHSLLHMGRLPSSNSFPADEMHSFDDREQRVVERYYLHVSDFPLDKAEAISARLAGEASAAGVDARSVPDGVMAKWHTTALEIRMTPSIDLDTSSEAVSIVQIEAKRHTSSVVRCARGWCSVYVDLHH